MHRARATAVLVALALVVGVAACGDDGGDDASSATTTTAPEATDDDDQDGAGQADDDTDTDVAIHDDLVAALADDELEGRAPSTPGSARAQEIIIEQLEQIAEPLGEDYRQPFDHGVNLVGVIPGTDLADEHVVLGAHYDGLGRGCDSEAPDEVCNGATDNAAGVALVLEIGRRIAAEGPPSRSVVLALWDAEEIGLLGSTHYVAEPLVPLEQTVAYLNWDIVGANLLPSLRDVTLAIGAETGGQDLVDVVEAATSRSELDHLHLSLLFGQGRSDHAPFAAAGVPIVFFGDATAGCYHTAQDDLSVVDVGKLSHQIDTGTDVVRRLASDADATPTFAAEAPVATYDDARSMLAAIERAEPDLDRFGADGQAAAEQYRTDLEAIVDAGPDAFDEAATGTLLGGAATVVELLAGQECDGFLG